MLVCASGPDLTDLLVYGGGVPVCQSTTDNQKSDYKIYLVTLEQEMYLFLRLALHTTYYHIVKQIFSE